MREVEDALFTAVGLHWYVIRLLALAAAMASGADWPDAHTAGVARKRWQRPRGTVARGGERMKEKLLQQPEFERLGLKGRRACRGRGRRADLSLEEMPGRKRWREYRATARGR